MQRHGIAVLGLLLLVTLLAACQMRTWPVPVPEQSDVAGLAKRFELALPLREPADCQQLSRQAFLQTPQRCPPLHDLTTFLIRHAERRAAVSAAAFELDTALWALMQALTSAETLRVAPFPEGVTVLPDDIRQRPTWAAIDARDRTPPQGRPTVAFLYRDFWWTFWQKSPPPPPPPGSGIDPRARTPYDRVIVFPDFPGQRQKGD